MSSQIGRLLRMLKWLFVVLVVIMLSLLLWGNDLLIAIDPMPAHVDAAVVLQGSIVAQKARIAGAMNFLQRGVADRVLLSVPKESYWGQSIPPVARAYMERSYGSDLSSRVDFCDTSAEVNSTAEEAEAAMSCVQQHHWRSIAVVTSDYHTRRAGILWRRVIKQRDPTMSLSTEGVADPEFQRPWWRHRQSAKIWLGESTKLVWSILGG
jgi:uncharacterized SAM-binding protein YcdF (DUF218 family)